MIRQEKTVLTRKGKRGPAPTGKGFTVGVRLQPDLLAWVDAERAKLDPAPSRPEFIRRILEERSQKKGDATKPAKALSDLATFDAGEGLL